MSTFTATEWKEVAKDILLNSKTELSNEDLDELVDLMWNMWPPKFSSKVIQALEKIDSQ